MHHPMHACMLINQSNPISLPAVQDTLEPRASAHADMHAVRTLILAVSSRPVRATVALCEQA